MLAPRLLLALAFVAILGVPFALRPRAQTSAPAAARSLVIVTPHTEQIRSEFARAFEAWHLRTYSEPVSVDWRVPGGTSEILKQLEAQYEAAVARGLFDFSDPKDPKAPPGTIAYAMMLGGGSYEHARLKSGIKVRPPAGTAASPPGKQADKPAQTQSEFTLPMSAPAGFTKEQLDAWFGENKVGAQPLYDRDQFWIGTALSSFGIVYNKDIYRRLRLRVDPNLHDPKSFRDLCNPHLQGLIALADPRQSGSITTTFESIINWHVHDAAQREGWLPELEAALKKEREDPKRPAWEETLWETRGPSIQRAFESGFNLLREMACNTRYFTAAATKPPLDISYGEAAAGLAIDFYGRSQAQSILAPGQPPEESRVGYVDPAGTVYIDADPASILRGGSEPDLAKRFIEFSLSDEGQALWQFPARANPKSASNPKGPTGEPLGPIVHELRRLPVRRDFYARFAPSMIDQVDPFAIASDVRGVQWRSAIPVLMGAFGIDVADDARAAWAALNRARNNIKYYSSDAVRAMEDAFYAFPTSPVPRKDDPSAIDPDAPELPLDARNIRKIRGHWRDRTFQSRCATHYANFFRAQYREVQQLEHELWGKLENRD